jgi:hypothetical protein
VDAAEFRVCGEKEALLFPAGPERKDYLLIRRLMDLGYERAGQIGRELRHDPLEEKGVHRSFILRRLPGARSDL